MKRRLKKENIEEPINNRRTKRGIRTACVNPGRKPTKRPKPIEKRWGKITMSNSTNNNQENRIIKQGDFSYKTQTGGVRDDINKSVKPTEKPVPIKKR